MSYWAAITTELSSLSYFSLHRFITTYLPITLSTNAFPNVTYMEISKDQPDENWQMLCIQSFLSQVSQPPSLAF